MEQQDEDAFQEGEQRPSAQAVEAMKRILLDAEESYAKIPAGEISAFYGELAVTWKVENRTLRFAVYSDGREPLLYFQTDTGEALTRGESIRPVTTDALKSKLSWLLTGQNVFTCLPEPLR